MQLLKDFIQIINISQNRFVILILAVIEGVLLWKFFTLQNIASNDLLWSIQFIAGFMVLIVVLPFIEKFTLNRQGLELIARVEKLEKQIDRFLLLIVLDCFEYGILKELKNDKDVFSFWLNPSAINTLIRLKNRDLIVDKKEKSLFLTKIEQPYFLLYLRRKKIPYPYNDIINPAEPKNDRIIINLKDFVKITEQGCNYLKLSEQFDQQLSATSQKYLDEDKKLLDLLQKPQEQKS